MEHNSLKFVSRAKPKAGDWVIMALLEKEIRALLYEPGNPKHNPSALQVVSFPYQYVKVKLAFNEFTKLENAKTAMIYDPEESKERKKYSTYVEFPGTDEVIATRTEFVNLRFIETHPYSALVTTEDGAFMKIALLIKWEIIDPLKVLMWPDFLDDSSKSIAELMVRWVGKTPYSGVRLISTDDTHVDKELMDAVKEYNKTRFEPHGFRITDVDAPIRSLMPGSEKFAEIEQDLALSFSKIKMAENEFAAGKKTNELVILQNNTDVDYKTKLADIIPNALGKMSKQLVDINRATLEGAKETKITHYMATDSAISKDIVTSMIAAINLNSEPRRDTPA